MLYNFLEANRTELISRCRSAMISRGAPEHMVDALQSGIPLFLDELIETLRREHASRSPDHDEADEGRAPTTRSRPFNAALHGRELFEQGFPVDHVVRDYGDLCQAITGLAFELGSPIEVDEFKTVNRCLDDGIADAVTGYACQHESVISSEQLKSFNERLGFLAHELRNQLHIAMLAVSAMRSGKVALSGSTGALLDRSHITMSSLIDRSLADVRITAGMASRNQQFSVSEFVAELQVSAALEASHRKCSFAVIMEDAGMVIDADRELLRSALGNLLQNAFKFTQYGTSVMLRVHASDSRVLFDIEDHCGGLPPAMSNRIFQPFTQVGHDTSGLGLGLSITRRIVEASSGELRVRDVPGHGCVFTIDLPKLPVASTASAQNRLP